jgi:hypothetical protein
MNNESAIILTLPKDFEMKKWILILFFSVIYLLLTIDHSFAQCSICTRTAQQQGERPAKALNGGILYLAFMPLAIFGIIGYRWWRSNSQEQ